MFIRRLHLVGLLVLCFLAGGVIGNIYGSLGENLARKHAPRRMRLSDLVKQIDLSAEQKAALDKILDDGRKSMVNLNKRVKPEFDAIRVQVRNEIRQVLSEEQRELFNRLLEERDEQIKERKGAQQGSRRSSGFKGAV